MLLIVVAALFIVGVVYACRNAQYVSHWVLVIGGAACFVLGLWPIIVVDVIIYIAKQQAIRAALEQKEDRRIPHYKRERPVGWPDDDIIDEEKK